MINKIAVLITCHNRKEKTLACLDSLFECDLPNDFVLDVFLVDDGSTDGTNQEVKQKFPQVNIIQGSGNLFWNKGMHLAWETAARYKDFEYYLWLNDDVKLFAHAILYLLNVPYSSNAIIVGTMKSGIKEITTYGGQDFNNRLISPNGTPQICTTFNGNFVLIPRIVFRKVGNLDPIFPHAIGDFDYALRAKKEKIDAYIASEYSGCCEKNLSLPKWCLPEVNLKDRIISLYSPLGNAHPYFYFRYEKRHFGILKALWHFCTIHIRLVFPSLWKNQI
jgi:GT2 family glycosyltransferase